MNINFDERKLREKYRRITQTLIDKGKTITTMESATSGQIASLITDTKGSSAIFFGGLVTYSNSTKIKYGVPKEIIEEYGVYSTQTANAMAEVARKQFDTDYAIGVTGTMGNVDPANSDSVPGKVFSSIASSKFTESFEEEIPPQESRIMYKLVVADKIADELLKKLNYV